MAAADVLDVLGAVRRSRWLRGYHVPQLRHGTATLLLAAGVPDAVVVQIMGHADTRILRRYQDVIPDLMRDAGARLEALLAD